MDTGVDTGIEVRGQWTQMKWTVQRPGKSGHGETKQGREKEVV